MSERHLKGPDEGWETVSKDNTRDTLSGFAKNRQKPDDVRVKGEITEHVEETDEAEEEE